MISGVHHDPAPLEAEAAAVPEECVELVVALENCRCFREVFGKDVAVELTVYNTRICTYAALSELMSAF